MLNRNDQIMSVFNFSEHKQPGIWNYILPKEMLQWTLPQEVSATCSNCPKIQNSQYRDDYRCCTYFPQVPNYGLGFATQDPQVRKLVLSLIDDGYIIPEGSQQSPLGWIYYLEDGKNDTFGKSTKVLCPYLNLESGYCSIYAFRNAVCSTFFCENDLGKKAQVFWDKVQVLVSQIEIALAQWALDESGFSIKSYFERFDDLASGIKHVSSVNGGWSEAARKVLFGSWFSKELTLMESCAKVIYEAREDLWDIANTYTIQGSEIFDKAKYKMVPSKLKSELSEDDYEEGEAESPDNLYKALCKSYNSLQKSNYKKIKHVKRTLQQF